MTQNKGFKNLFELTSLKTYFDNKIFFLKMSM